jgi:hypothetical protein
MPGRTADEKYTDPRLRERIKRRLKRSARGGRPGQWSARKSQLLVQEYERRGGGYRGGKDEAARSLGRWSAQRLSTRDEAARARGGGSVARYLPREAWRRLSPAERREAETSKRRAERQGRSRVAWPAAVKRVMRELDEEREQTTKAALYERARALDLPRRSRMNKAQLYEAVVAAEAKAARPPRRARR